ncbi:hypothetical protein CDAR_573931 [Caerostris darwini]|uniref:Uncharacterized protein n=1 Tax=Caerostris darwini TaxID=1538125 RepID=A0AAV4T6Z9_9ARAC|nr:hypothetical protein CDAR_573931 [Caerostris darwini]
MSGKYPPLEFETIYPLTTAKLLMNERKLQKKLFLSLGDYRRAKAAGSEVSSEERAGDTRHLHPSRSPRGASPTISEMDVVMPGLLCSEFLSERAGVRGAECGNGKNVSLVNAQN